jgi:hypothetical protein
LAASKQEIGRWHAPHIVFDYLCNQHSSERCQRLIVIDCDPCFFCFCTEQDTDEERHAAIAVRLHRTIELQDDKYFLISCSQSSFYSGRNRVRSRVRLQLLNIDGTTTKHRLAIGGKYLLRAQLQQPTDSSTSGTSSLPTPLPNNNESPDSTAVSESPPSERLIAADYRLFLRQCIAFGQLNASETQLIGADGCSSDRSIMSPFTYTAGHRNGSQALLDARIDSMFKLPDSNRLHIQCDAMLCAPSVAALCERRYTCGQLAARTSGEAEEASAVSTGSIVRLVTATTVYVLDADQADAFGRLDGDSDTCTDRHTSWLIALSAVLGSLLLIMLLVNICLCGSMTCTCGRSDRHVEDESTIDDYDPYKVDWSASHGHHGGVSQHAPYSANPADSLPRHSAYATHDLSDDSYEPNQRSLSRYSANNAYPGKHQSAGYHNYGFR